MGIVASFHRFSDLGTLVNRFRLTTSTSAVNEGGSVTFTFYTFGMPNGSTFYYTIVGTNITSSDFTDGAISGSFTVTNDVGVITKTLALDGTTEVGESFILNVHVGSTSGEVAMTSSEVFITDGTVVVYSASGAVNEGASLGFTVSTSSTPVSTLYWEIVNITSNNTDFSATTGTVAISSNTGTFNITTIADLSTEGGETFRVDIRAHSSSGPVVASSSNVTITDTSLTPTNQVLYNTPGGYTWVAPAGVTSVSVVAVGGGAGAGRGYYITGGTNYGGGGGGGGGLGWKNNITVVPGQSYTVVVGNGGQGSNTDFGTGTAGGASYFINSSTVSGNGGAAGSGTVGGAGGTYVGDGGGNGGVGGSGSFNTYAPGNGGGGAGGYTGDGGNGGRFSSVTGSYAGQPGSGGGGGGGQAAYYSGTLAYGGHGGGVGVYGQGSNGTGGGDPELKTVGNNGGPGSGGSSYRYGGGEGGNQGVFSVSSPLYGAVRIIWPGTSRQFPSTKTIDYVAISSTSTVSGTKYLAVSTTITPFSPMSVTGGSGSVTYSISPALPGSLTINTSTGSISGSTPSTATSKVTYTVTATDTLDFSTSIQFDMEIQVLGQIEYTSGGSYSWVCPSNVTSVSVICVGGGAGGTFPNGGGGGGLGWKNNIAVTPGQSYTVVVGSAASEGQNGNQSYFISSATVSGNGGTGSTGGGYVGDGGGTGGNGGTGATNKGAGGGGAAGYTDNGGRGGAGGSTWSTNPAINGYAGGGAGGMGAGTTSNIAGGGGGGGVGIKGQGTNGTVTAVERQAGGGGSGAPINANNGTNSSSTSTAHGGSGGSYGGGGGGKGFTNSIGGTGGGGAVRIIWPGNQRQFPSTRTADE